VTCAVHTHTTAHTSNIHHGVICDQKYFPGPKIRLWTWFHLTPILTTRSYNWILVLKASGLYCFILITSEAYHLLECDATVFTDVSEECTSYIYRIEEQTVYFRNIVPDYTVSHSRRQYSSQVPPRKLGMPCQRLQQSDDRFMLMVWKDAHVNAVGTTSRFALFSRC
jgi:hypothetical protein